MHQVDSTREYLRFFLSESAKPGRLRRLRPAFKSGDIVSLPGVNADGDFREALQRLMGVHSAFRIDCALVFKHPFVAIHGLFP